jgi:cytochrome c oxidase subunit IV
MNARTPLIRPCTLVWLLLVLFTAMTYAIGESGLAGTGIMLLVLGTAVVKVQMVANYFMGLRNTRWLWRSIVLVWLLLVAVLIAIAYLQSIR